MEFLYGKKVEERIINNFEERLHKLKITPNIAVLAIKGSQSSEIYMRNIEKNCKKYGIGFNILVANDENEFKDNFNKIKGDKSITGIMFQQPLAKEVNDLINEIPFKKDIEGIGIENMGKLFLGKKDAIIPCTSKAVMEMLDFYNIELEGKKVAILGRSNTVGKPLIPQLLEKNATVTICHSKTKNIQDELKNSDIVIIAIGRANFLKKEMIKENSIIIDVGINTFEGKVCGDVDFEDVKGYVKAITPVPGGIGIVTNALLIDNIIKSVE